MEPNGSSHQPNRIYCLWVLLHATKQKSNLTRLRPFSLSHTVHTVGTRELLRVGCALLKKWREKIKSNTTDATDRSSFFKLLSFTKQLPPPASFQRQFVVERGIWHACRKLPVIWKKNITFDFGLLMLISMFCICVSVSACVLFQMGSSKLNNISVSRKLSSFCSSRSYFSYSWLLNSPRRLKACWCMLLMLM